MCFNNERTNIKSMKDILVVFKSTFKENITKKNSNTHFEPPITDGAGKHFIHTQFFLLVLGMGAFLSFEKFV